MKRAGNIALAMGVGYVLGRRRKLRKALVLGAAVATGRLAKRPAGRVLGGAEGDETPGDSGALARLGGAGKAAARTAFSRPVDILSERINETAEALRQGGKPKNAEGQQQSQPSDESR